ncbi:MAG: C39 family peptidase [Planctomycetota bacterium]|nr:C39 family peptidase [Planctomycetota bacterium]
MKRLTAIAIVLWAVSAAAGVPAPAAPAQGRGYADVLIKDVPHVKQKPDFCGEACAEMTLAKLGKKWTQDDVFNAAGVDPLLARGCYAKELAAALARIGFKVGEAQYRIVAVRAAEELEAQWAALHADLARGIPSIVCTHYDDQPKTTEHFRLILGYDRKTDEVIYHEPAADDGAYRRMKREMLIKLWPLKYAADAWTAVRMRLEPAMVAAPPVRPEGFTPADYCQHIIELKKKLPAGFSLAMAPPMVVVGDEPAPTVRMRAQSTVSWAIQRLKLDYFRKDPERIIDVWLFKDKESYEKNAQALFGDPPHTPFGWYSSTHNALIMNIATGGGTLVHEIVHPFMRANFAECPDWFNEGLASLYEQSEDKGGHIRGRTNWRLEGLQKAIGAGKLPAFEALCGTTNAQFYNEDRGSNYAQARYLCYYLQEKGLLVKYYRQFVAGQKDDPTGYKSLKAVLGEADMAAFQKRWETYVMWLRFP